jgi:uncharacterized protein YraI
MSLVVAVVPTNLVSASNTTHDGDNLNQVAAGNVWTAQFYNSLLLEGPVVATLTYPAGPLHIDWQLSAPANGVFADGWSARFTRVVNFPIGGQIRFDAKADDTVTVYVDDRVVTASAPYFADIVYDSFITITPGNHTIEVHYSDLTAQAFVFVNWSCGESTVTSPSGITGTVSAGTGLNFRSTPTISTDNKIGVLSGGETYAILGKTADGKWAYLEANGVRGWASAFWLDLSGSLDSVPVVGDTFTAPAPIATGEVVQTVLPIYNVVIRDCADTSCSRIGLALWQTPVEVYGQSADGEWILIRYTNQQGTDVVGWTFKSYYRTNDDIAQLLPNLPVVH